MSIIKWNWFQVDPDDSRIIDNNDAVEQRISSEGFTPVALTKKKHSNVILPGDDEEPEEDPGFSFSTDDDFEPGEFRGGLDAQELEGYIDDPDDTSSIIKAQDMMPAYDGPSPEEMIAGAQEEIDEMFRKAQAEIDFAKKQAAEEGRAAGSNQGYSEGLARAQAELDQKKAELEAQYQQMMRDLEPEFVKQLCGIYEHIFHVKLSEYQSLIMQLIETCMLKLEGSGSYIIHISPEDYPYVSMQKKALSESLGNRNATLDVVEDGTLKKNECMIETEGGIYDCSLDSQLSALRRELMTLSYQGEE